MERFPYASKNSYRKLPRSGFLFVLGFELGGREIAEGRMQPLAVVDLFQKLADGGACLGQVAIFVAQDFFVLQRFRDMLMVMALVFSRSV